GGIGITILLYILGFFDKKDLEIIKVCISLAAVFATFGGAYLGAKISGQDAIKLSNQQLLINYSEDLLKYLIKVENIRKDIKKDNTYNIFIIIKLIYIK